MRAFTSSVIATVLVVCSAGQAVMLMIVLPWSGWDDVALHLLIEGTALLSGPLVLMLAWAVRPRSPASAAAALLAASAPLMWTSLVLAIESTVVANPIWDTTAGALVVRTTWLGWAAPLIGLTAALRLSSVYPDDLGEHYRQKLGSSRRLVPYMQGLAFDTTRLVAVSVLVPTITVGTVLLIAQVAERIGLTRGEDAVTAVAFLVLLTWIVVMVIAAIRNFLLGFGVAGQADQRRALWSVTGIVSAGVAILLSACLWLLAILDLMPEVRIEWLVAPVVFAPLLIVVGLYLAIFYEGSLDPRLVIRRSAITGLLAIVVTPLFALADAAASEMLAAFSPGASEASGWAAGAIAALAIGPLHNRVRARVDAWIDERVPDTDLAETPRHQAVIVFSDIVGYSALTSGNEDDALTMMSVFHRAARKVADQHQGRLVKTMGDGVILEFTDAPKAVTASLQLASSFRAACDPLGLPEGRLRTGIHFGEVSKRRDGDLFGDAVNIASRLEGAAEPGQIVVSQVVADQLDIELEDLGERSLKNVPGPVRCWAVRT